MGKAVDWRGSALYNQRRAFIVARRRPIGTRPAAKTMAGQKRHLSIPANSFFFKHSVRRGADPRDRIGPFLLTYARFPCTLLKKVQGSRFRVQGSRFRVQGSGFRVQGSGLKVQGSRFRVQGSGFKVQGSGFKVQGSEFRVLGLGFRVQGSRFRVQGSGFNV